MLSFRHWRPAFRLLFGLALASFALAAAPYNSPIIDGNIGGDWRVDEELLVDTPGDSPWGGNDLASLWVTWDAANLYLGIDYSVDGNGLTAYLDVGDGGSISFRSEDGWSGAWPRAVTSDRDIEIFLGAWDGAAPGVYRAYPDSSTDVGGSCPSASGGSYHAEVAIPWSILYPSGVPVGAEIGAAVLLVGGDGYFAADAMPNQPTVGDGEGPDNLENFQTISVDADSDGVPDFSGVAVPGRVTFEDIPIPPFPGAEISYNVNGDFFGETFSDSLGYFSLTGVADGDTLDIRLSRIGWEPESLLGYIVETEPESVFFELVPQSGAILGTVSPSDVECMVHAVSGTDTAWSDTTDPSGEFELTHLAPGSWSVIAVPTSPDYAETVLDTSLAEGETLSVDLILDPAAVLREWTDASGDDYGPGSYTYPTEPVFVEGAFDILSVTVKDFQDAGQIEFEIEMGDIPPYEVVNWAPYYPPLSLQKIDIYIDTHGGGSSQGLENRFANFVATDYWDFAISADGWWVGMFASNGQSIADNYTQNVTGVQMSADTAANLIRIRVDTGALIDHLGPADLSEFEYWDFIVLSLGHDGSGFEGIRWVNPGSASNWNFGGGADGNIDPNIIDMSVSAGLDPATELPKEEADPQEIQLDWTLEEAPPVLLSAHRPVDISPPEIEYDTARALVHLVGTQHLLIRADITDNIAAEKAWLHYSTGGEFDSVSMGKVEGATEWFGDILVPSEIDSTTPLATSLEFYFSASDDAGNRAVFPGDGETEPPEYPFAVVSDNPSRRIPAPYSVEELRSVFDAGSSGDSLIFDMPTGDRIAFAAADLPDFPATPCTVGVRYSSFAGSPGEMVELSAVRRLIEISGAAPDPPMNLRLHWMASRLGSWEPQRITLAEYGGDIPMARPYGGSYYHGASVIQGQVTLGSGFWAVARDLRERDAEGALRNIRFSPNPFSPNGDGIYDRTAISWETDYDGSIDIDIYNLSGDHIARLARDMAVSAGKNPNLWWDGISADGRPSPPGIYAVRFELTYITGGVELRIRENRPLVIIK